MSAAGASLDTPLAGTQPLQQRETSRLEVTLAIIDAGTAAQSLVRRNAHNHSYFVHLATIAAGPALSELRRLMLYEVYQGNPALYHA